MPVLDSKLNPATAEFAANVAHNRALVADLRAKLAQYAQGGPAQAKAKHSARAGGNGSS